MGRAPCCDKVNVKKGPWSPEEDAKLKSYIEQHGTGGNWIALPQKIGLKRCGKSCRLRWLNYLRPNIKHGGFSEEEDNIICSLYISIGSRWSIIAAQLPGRTDNDIKNYWNTRLKKKLLGSKQRKEVKKDDDNRNVNIWMNNGISVSSTYWADQPSILPTNNYPVNQSAQHSSQLPTAVAPIQTDHFLMADDVMLGCDDSAKLEGLDCFYGFGNMMVDDNNGTSTTTTDVDWCEVSPLNCLFEEEPGMQ